MTRLLIPRRPKPPLPFREDQKTVPVIPIRSKPTLSFRRGQKAALVIPRRSQTDEGIFSPSRLPPCKQTLCHLGFSAANAANRPCSSFCPPTRQRFRPFRALCRTRLQPDSPQRHIFRICVLSVAAYWSSSPSSSAYGCRMSFDGGLMYRSFNCHRMGGLSVRCVRESYQ